MIARGYHVYGPFLAAVDFDLPVQFMICTHSSRWNPSSMEPSSLPFGAPGGICPDHPILLESIRSMRLIVETATDTIVVSFSPANVDAVFFTVSAFDKFVVRVRLAVAPNGKLAVFALGPRPAGDQ